MGLHGIKARPDPNGEHHRPEQGRSLPLLIQIEIVKDSRMINQFFIQKTDKNLKITF